MAHIPSLIFSSIIIWIISWPSQVQGLKCYVCDSSMPDCYSNVPSKYLKECHESAYTCATVSLEIPFYKTYKVERWFQRDCFYRSDYDSFNFENYRVDFPMEKNEVILPGWAYDQIIEPINYRRKENKVTEMVSAPPSYTYLSPFVRAKTCDVSSNGCNDWEGIPVFSLAEGYPIENYRPRDKGIKCWKCATELSHESVWATPEDLLKKCRDFIAPFGPNEWRIDSENSYKALGCSTLSIYQSSPTGRKSYLERGLWYPGDHWCLLQTFPSTPSDATARSLVTYTKSGNDQKKKENCQEAYARAVNGNNLQISVSYSGQRVFHTPQEFRDFLTCKLSLRYRVGRLSQMTVINLNEIMKRHAENFVPGEGPFAFVGFHFCGPNTDNCNDWSDDKLYKVMVNPPTTTTTTTTATTTTSGPNPATTEKLNNGTGGSTGGGTFPGDVTDDQCSIKYGKGKGGICKGSFLTILTCVLLLW